MRCGKNGRTMAIARIRCCLVLASRAERARRVGDKPQYAQRRLDREVPLCLFLAEKVLICREWLAAHSMITTSLCSHSYWSNIACATDNQPSACQNRSAANEEKCQGEKDARSRVQACGVVAASTLLRIRASFGQLQSINRAKSRFKQTIRYHQSIRKIKQIGLQENCNGRVSRYIVTDSISKLQASLFNESTSF